MDPSIPRHRANSLRATFSWCPAPRSCTAHDWAVSFSQHLQYSHHLFFCDTQNCGRESQGGGTVSSGGSRGGV